jgi:hypothetical protein
MKLVTKNQISAINSCREKCDENYLLYKILNTPGLKTYYIFSSLINFEVVNVGKTKWISLLETKREQMLQIGKYKYLIHLYSNTWFELNSDLFKSTSILNKW